MGHTMNFKGTKKSRKTMGLRGAVLFLPLFGALFLPGRIPARFAAASIIAGPMCVLFGSTLLRLPFDSLFLGMLAGLGIMGAGLWRERQRV